MNPDRKNVRKKIFVPEDEPEVRSFLAEELGEDGYEVVLAKNGLQALNEIPFQPFTWSSLTGNSPFLTESQRRS